MIKQIALVSAIMLVIPAVASAKECRKAYVEGSNAALVTGRSLELAKDNALLSWGMRVSTSAGPFYVSGKNARNRSVQCVKQRHLNKCTARARPCAS